MEAKFTNKDFVKVLIWTYRFYYSRSPINTILLVVTRAISELNGLIYAALFAKTIDQIILVNQSTMRDISSVFPYIALILFYYVFLRGAINNVYQYTSKKFSHSSRIDLEIFIFKQLNVVGIQSLEDPETVNRIQRCQQWTYNTLDMLQVSITFLSNLLKAIIAAGSIVSFFPTMLPIVLLLTFIKRFPAMKFIKQEIGWQVENTESRRKVGESAFMLQNPTMLQEISIIGAYDYLQKQYTDFYKWYLDKIYVIFKNREVSGFILNIFDSIVTVTGYGIIFYNFIINQITIGTVTYQIRALDSFSDAMQNMLSSSSFLNEFAIKVNDLVSLSEMEPLIRDGAYKLPRLNKPPKIEFRNVSFTYPKATKPVFEDLNLTIESGEKVALVGHNGAGKTTLIKLLARIYSVTKGEILINNININDLTIDDWYKNLGVLFQDYNFYPHLTVKENIFIGKSLKKLDEEKIIASAESADAHDFIQEYTKKYDEIMSEKYKGGTRPSTGQQQKIAIARFFYRNAPLAVFDEPTAAIDAVSEYKIFNQIYKFFENKTVIIVSHRFSTVRSADRIIVLEKGKIVEEGSHKMLVKQNGTYASAYKLQAEGYQN